MPNLDWTFLPTILPTFSLPVKETSETEFRIFDAQDVATAEIYSPMSTSWLSAIDSPTSLPPVTRPATAPGTPFRSKTPETILVTAMEHSDVLGEGFQIVALPAAIEIARFLHFDAVHPFDIRVTKTEASIPAIYGNGEIKRGQDPKDAERVRN